MNRFDLKIGDCRKVMGTIGKVDYVFTVPPDFDEIGLDPKNDEHFARYGFMLTEAMETMMSISPIITIGITDRKRDGKIFSKHSFIIQFFLSNQWHLLSHKIWVKSVKRNLYRLTYSHIMSFAKGSAKQNHPNIYEQDVFLAKEQKYRTYGYGMNEEVVYPFIFNFTNEGDTVLDPFLGSGTTAVVCLQNGRNCIGIEIDKGVAELANNRVSQYGGIERARKLFE